MFPRGGIDQPEQQVFAVKPLKTSGYIVRKPVGVSGEGREVPLYSILGKEVG
jgi:hypothetical protein